MARIIGTTYLVNNFSDSNALNVAGNGQLAVISGGGVHTLLYDASPSSQQSPLNVKIDKISVPVNIFMPTSEIKFRRRKTFGKAPAFILDHSVNVLIKSNENETQEITDGAKSNKTKKPEQELPKVKIDQRGPWQVRWSPKNSDSAGGCLLAVLWFDHRLMIYSYGSNDCIWHEIADISKLWQSLMHEHIKICYKRQKNVEVDNELDEEVEKLKAECYMQAAVAIAWSPLYSNGDCLEPNSKEASFRQARTKKEFSTGSGNDFCLMAVALKSGCIIVFKVDLPANDAKNFHISLVLDYGCDISSYLTFIPINNSLVYLCQGNANGTVLLHCIHLEDDVKSLPQDNQPLNIWSDVDRMAVTGLIWSSDKSVLIASKGQTLITWQLDEMENGHPVVRSVKAPAVSADISIHNVLCLQAEVFLSCMNGQIYKTSLDEIDDRSSNYQPGYIDLPWNFKECRINGLTASPNGVFIVVAISPSVYYCHLTLRKPSKIQWLCLKSREEISSLVLHERESLQDASDALAYLKSEWFSRHQWPDSINVFLNDRDSWSTYTIYQLKLLRYLLQLQILSCQSDSNQQNKESLLADLVMVEEMIMVQNTHRIVRHCIQLDIGSLFSDTESMSFSLIVNWLRKKCQKASDVKQIEKLAKKLQSRTETCKICQSSIPFDNFQKGSCANEHIFSRCNQTLLLCQDYPYRVCSFCKALALAKDSSECSRMIEFGILGNECTYCDGRLV